MQFIIYLFLLLLSHSIQAHQLKLFITVIDNQAEGMVYFTGNGRGIADATVTIVDSQQQSLGQVITDAQGKFYYPLIKKQDYQFTVNLGEGHHATYTVTADLIHQNDCSTQGLEQQIATVISRQLQPLREQINQYQDKIYWHDILGGIGYLIGLTGLWFFFLKRRT